MPVSKCFHLRSRFEYWSHGYVIVSRFTAIIYRTKHGDSDTLNDRSRPILGFLVTERMIEMGVLEARDHSLGAPLSDLFRKVFIAISVEL